MKEGWLYILASKRNGTPDTGVTSDFIQRLHEHREGVVPGRGPGLPAIRADWVPLSRG